MANLKFKLPTSVRAHPGVKKRLKIRLLQLEEVTPARFDGQDELTLEAVTNALWRYFAAMDDAQAVAFLARELPNLEAFMRGRAAEEAESGEFNAASIDPTPEARPRRKRGAQ